jgi:hypothetical protein
VAERASIGEGQRLAIELRDGTIGVRVDDTGDDAT